MPEIHFYHEKKAGKDGKCLLFLQMNYYSKYRLKHSIGERIHPDQWDKSREMPRKNYRHYHSLRQILEAYRDTTDNIFRDYIAKRIIPSTVALKEAIKEKMAPREVVKKTDLISYLEKFIQERSRSASFTTGTIQTYRSLLADLKRYQEYIPFESIDVRWLNTFKNSLNDIGLAQNTVTKKLSTLRTVLTEATEDGLNTSYQYKSNRVKSSRVETTQIYLSEPEIERFYRVECQNKEQEEARDIFVLMCYTGPRVSDAWKISKSTFFVEEGIEYFMFNQKKTKQPVYIPVHPYVREIMEKYNWELPTRSRQRLSDHIKNIGKLAKLDQMIDLVSYPGSKMTITKAPKWTQIKTHTGRRSLACNMLLAGVPEKIVMSVGGWKSSKSFQPYVRLTANDKLKVASRSHFFTGARVIGIGS